MQRRHIEVTQHSAAPPTAVFALLVDGETWPRWSPIEAFELERSGDPPPEGVRAIRVFRRGRTTGRDEILEVVPDRRLSYRSLSGLPEGVLAVEPTRHDPLRVDADPGRVLDDLRAVFSHAALQPGDG